VSVLTLSDDIICTTERTASETGFFKLLTAN